MKKIFFGLVFLGFARAVELCGETCEEIDQQFKEVNELIHQDGFQIDARLGTLSANPIEASV